MADLPEIRRLSGLFASGQFTSADMQKWFSAGGGPEDLMRMLASGSMAQQLGAAGRTQQEQLGLRQALLQGRPPAEEGGAMGLSTIQQMFSPQSFNPYAGPQTMPGSPFAGMDMSQIFSTGLETGTGAGQWVGGDPNFPPEGPPKQEPPPPRDGGVGAGIPAGPPVVAGAGAGIPAAGPPAPGGDVMGNLKAFLAAIKGVPQ